ncbi:MAG: mechanosensitive ion channel domain-containing protein [Bacteroidota bacterium]
MEEVIKKGTELATEYVPKLLLAIAVLVIGNWIIKRVLKVVKKGLAAREMEAALKTFLGDLVRVMLYALLFISAAGMVGIETTSFVAILGAAGLAVGLALQGSLANFAGGVLILLFKPFRVGDLVEGQGYIGHVTAINIFVTTLKTPDHKQVIIPNGELANGSIVNYTSLGKLRVDLVIGISYDSNIQQARDVIMEVMKNDPKVLPDPAPSVTVLELADSSVNLAVRPHATTADYWDVYFGITEKAKVALDQAGIEIPFPQRVVHQAKA